MPGELNSEFETADGPILNGTSGQSVPVTKNNQVKEHPSELNITQSDANTGFLRAARAGNLDKVLEFLKQNIDINTSNANGLNALHLASKDGHVHVVTELLKRGANVDAATKKGNTALHIASLAGQEEVVKILVQNAASVNVQSQNGFTPLYMAAQENHDNVVRFLLANGANQSLATEDGFTPLAVAMQQGHDKVVAVLLENDTRGKVRLPALHIAAKKDDCKAAALLLQNDHNPDVTSKSGFTPLHIAAHYGNESIANLLLQRGADVNYSAKHNISPLHVAAKWGKVNMVSLLLDKGGNIEAKTRDGLTPLHCAARSGHEQVVDMLLERGGPISSKTKNGLAPLHMASQGDHVDAARILLYHKAPVDEVTVDYLTALHVAAHCGHVRVAKLLLDRKADPNARALNGFTPLHIACKKNRIKVVELLLKHGGSIEATTESGLTPLHVASFMGCMNIAIYLIQHGASPDVPTVRGETPLHLAARANQTDIVRILLRNGAEVDARAREQQTPLHIASRLGNVDIVVLLLQHGAQVDATTKDLYSALHIAAKEGQEEVASVLVEHGASLTCTTKKGFTPLHLSAKYGNLKVARLLLQRDAPVDAQGKNGVTPLHVASHYDHQNLALLLLDKGASPHATAKNGYTPLHIAAKKNQMDIATTLLEYGAKTSAESKAGFTPLHLSSQEGHTDMATLLIEHQADPNHKAKNGLSPLHLCAQEDRVNVAAVLVKNGAEVDAQTKGGYTPLHVACHFGQLNMVRFLLQHGSEVAGTTSMGYTPLHQAAQQGHSLIIHLLLEHKAQPNALTNQGQTALSIAQRLGYISVVETLKVVTETTVTTTTTTVVEEKYRVVAPETMHETFMSDSEDEGGEDNVMGDHSYRYLTVDEMKSLGDDSLPIDVTKDERDANRESMTAPPAVMEDSISPQHVKEQYAQFTGNYVPDNIEVSRHPVMIGKLQWRTFLVSFMVDARGGAMRGCRHSGVRVIIPPRKASMPMRVTCRYLKKDRLTHPPPLMEGEALASRILELGPSGAKFLGPVIIEVPHFASLREKEREIVILRSDSGETWREHTLEATEEAVQEVLNESFDGEELKQLEDLNTNRITRILTTDFPQYFAIVSRVRQEVHAIGPEGGMVSSSVVPQVQAVFPQGALTKKIKVGLQAHPIPPGLVSKLLGNRVAVSPIVTVEPRRRKFHKPITLTIPVPQAASKGMINQYSGDTQTLRLLCSITGGTTRAQWEDVTGSTPFTFVSDCVSFTTTVSARFWLMDCRNIGEATKMATELYKEAIHVPFMAKFVVFAKRVDVQEARLRVFCMTDDREDKTLEHQEHFTEVAKSRDVEVLEGKPQYVEFAGNLVPVTKSGEQLSLHFHAFRENRLPFTVRVKDPHADPIGRVAFMREPKVAKGDPPQTPICNLNLVLPDAIIPEAIPSEPNLLALENKYAFLRSGGGLMGRSELIHRAEFRLSDICNLLGEDWIGLASELGVLENDVDLIQTEYPGNAPQQATVMLRLWMQQTGTKATGNRLERALRAIGREDIVHSCVANVELVTDVIERAAARAQLDQSGFNALKDELGVSRDDSMTQGEERSYDERDLMKDSESVEELTLEELQRRTSDQDAAHKLANAAAQPLHTRTATEEADEERKYVGEEKEVQKEEESDENLPKSKDEIQEEIFVADKVNVTAPDDEDEAKKQRLQQLGEHLQMLEEVATIQRSPDVQEKPVEETIGIPAEEPAFMREAVGPVIITELVVQQEAVSEIEAVPIQDNTDNTNTPPPSPVESEIEKELEVQHIVEELPDYLHTEEVVSTGADPSLEEAARLAEEQLLQEEIDQHDFVESPIPLEDKKDFQHEETNGLSDLASHSLPAAVHVHRPAPPIPTAAAVTTPLSANSSESESGPVASSLEPPAPDDEMASVLALRQSPCDSLSDVASSYDPEYDPSASRSRLPSMPQEEVTGGWDEGMGTQPVHDASGEVEHEPFLLQAIASPSRETMEGSEGASAAPSPDLDPSTRSLWSQPVPSSSSSDVAVHEGITPSSEEELGPVEESRLTPGESVGVRQLVQEMEEKLVSTSSPQSSSSPTQETIVKTIPKPSTSDSNIIEEKHSCADVKQMTELDETVEGIQETIQSYSERKQFWEQMSSQGSKESTSKRWSTSSSRESSIQRSKTESDDESSIVRHSAEFTDRVCPTAAESPGEFHDVDKTVSDTCEKQIIETIEHTEEDIAFKGVMEKKLIFEAQIKIDMLSDQLSTQQEEVSPEHKILSPPFAMDRKMDTDALINRQIKSEIFTHELEENIEPLVPEEKLLSPDVPSKLLCANEQESVIDKSEVEQAEKDSDVTSVHVPKEYVQNVVWEVHLEQQQDLSLRETAEELPSQEHFTIRSPSLETEDEIEECIDHQDSLYASTPPRRLSQEEARKLAEEVVEEIEAEVAKRGDLFTENINESQFKTEQGISVDGEEDLLDGVEKELFQSLLTKKTEELRKRLTREETSSVEITDEDLRSSGADLSPPDRQVERLRLMSVDRLISEEDSVKRALAEVRESLEAAQEELIEHSSTDCGLKVQQSPSEFEFQLEGFAQHQEPIEEVEETIHEHLHTIKPTETAIHQKEDVVKITDENNKITIVEAKADTRKNVQFEEQLSADFGATNTQHSLQEVHKAEKYQSEDEKEMTESEVVLEISDKSGVESIATKEVFDEKCIPEDAIIEAMGITESTDITLKSEHHIEMLEKCSIDIEKTTTEKNGSVEFKRFGKASSQEEHRKNRDHYVLEDISERIDTVNIRGGKSQKVERKSDAESSSSSKEERMTLKADRRSGTDFEGWSSSSESRYHSFEQASDSGRTLSRPCSSDVEALLAGSGTAGSSEYESALTSQEYSAATTTTSQDYHTAVSSLSSRESMKSIESSESSGHLASVEISSETSETLVPSALELERDMERDVETPTMEYDEQTPDDVEPYDTEIPVHIIRSSVEFEDVSSGESSSFCDQVTEDKPVSGAEFHEKDTPESPQLQEDYEFPTPNMKRSIEMTFHPEPKLMYGESPHSESPQSQPEGAVVMGESLEDMSDKFSYSMEDSARSASLSSQSDITLKTVMEMMGNQSSLTDLDKLDLSLVSEPMSGSATSEQFSMVESREDIIPSVEELSYPQEMLSPSQILSTNEVSTSTYPPSPPNLPVHSVTITTSSIPSANGGPSACTQVTSEAYSEDGGEEEDESSEVYAHSNGPTEVDYIPEYDDDGNGTAPSSEEHSQPSAPPQTERRRHRRNESVSDCTYSFIRDINTLEAVVQDNELTTPNQALESNELESISDDVIEAMPESEKYQPVVGKEDRDTETKEIDEAEEESYETEADQAFQRDLRHKQEFDLHHPESDQLRLNLTDSDIHQMPTDVEFADGNLEPEIVSIFQPQSQEVSAAVSYEEETQERPRSPEPNEDYEITEDKTEFISGIQSDIPATSDSSHSETSESQISRVLEESIQTCSKWSTAAESEAAFLYDTSQNYTIEEEDEPEEKQDLEVQTRRSLTLSPLEGIVPDITITHHSPTIHKDFMYPDFEKEEDFPECNISTPQTPASGSSHVSDRSSETETDQGREYVLEDEDIGDTILEESDIDLQQEMFEKLSFITKGGEKDADESLRNEDKLHSLSADSFEMIERSDLTELADEYVMVLEEDTDASVRDGRPLTESDEPISPTPLSQMTDMKYFPSEEETFPEHEEIPFRKDSTDAPDAASYTYEMSFERPSIPNESDPEYEQDVHVEKQWIEAQFEQPDVAPGDIGFEIGFERRESDDVFRQPLEDIEERREEEECDEIERKDYDRFKDSLSSTPEYDVLAGRKYFAKNGCESDDVSMGSLQEFEKLEEDLETELKRKQSSGSQDSLNGKKLSSKNGQGDDVSLSSLQEFESLETACIQTEQIEKKAQEEEAMLSEIEEGHESQESEGGETLSEEPHGDATEEESDGEEYERRMFEIDEIIRQAQTNVEKFELEGVKVPILPVPLKEVMGRQGSMDEVASSFLDKTESLEREDADSLEDPQVPDLDLDSSGGQAYPLPPSGFQHPLVQRTQSGGSMQSTGHSSTVTHFDIESLRGRSYDDDSFMDSSGAEKCPDNSGLVMQSSTDSLEMKTKSGDLLTTSADSIEFQQMHLPDDTLMKSSDSSELPKSKEDMMTASADSIELEYAAKRSRDTMTTSADSIEIHTKLMTTSTDSLDLPSRVMTTSTDSLELGASASTSAVKQGESSMIRSVDSIEAESAQVDSDSPKDIGGQDRSSSSGREGDLSSSGKDDSCDRMVRLPHDSMMGSTDSLDPSSSTATHATYQCETDSVMSSSFTSGGSNTMVSSTETLDVTDCRRGAAVDRGEADDQVGEFMQEIRRTVQMPVQIQRVTFSGVDAEDQMRSYIKDFSPGEDIQESEAVDEYGNVHKMRVIQRRIVVESDEINGEAAVLKQIEGEDSIVEEVIQDEHGTVRRVIRKKRAVVSDVNTPVIRSSYTSDTSTTQQELTYPSAGGESSISETEKRPYSTSTDETGVDFPSREIQLPIHSEEFPEDETDSYQKVVTTHTVTHTDPDGKQVTETKTEVRESGEPFQPLRDSMQEVLEQFLTGDKQTSKPESESSPTKQ